MSCEDCPSMIYKSDKRTDIFTAGIEDFCGAGCLLVNEIRVPHPDCVAHSMPNTLIRNQGIVSNDLVRNQDTVSNDLVRNQDEVSNTFIRNQNTVPNPPIRNQDEVSNTPNRTCVIIRV